MSRACARKLPPLEVAAARGCHRCLGILLRGQEPLALQSGRSPAQEPGWPRRALSFLSEDGGDTWVALGDIPEAAPLSSTRRSLLDEPGNSGVPSLRPQCPQEPRGDTAVPLPPLASSTLLWDRDQPQEPPPSRGLETKTLNPSSPGLGDIAVPCPHSAGGVSPRQRQGGVLGTHAVSPRSPLPRGGFSRRSVAPQSSGDMAGDIPWGRAAVPDTEVTQPRDGDPAGLGDSTESFVTARESLGGAPGDATPAPTPRDSGEDLGPERPGAAPQVPELPGALGALLARLGGCSLVGSPPRSPGRATPRGCDNLGDRHVTPRSRSRLRAVASRLRSPSSSPSSSSSSSLSLFPMSPRAPMGAVTSPPCRCVTAGDRGASAADGGGTGGPWGDTRVVPGLSPSSGGSGPRVLWGLGDKRHPQNSLSPSRGSPEVSAGVWLVPGNRRHPRKSPCVTRGVPSATSSPEPEGGSGWQRHSPMGTSRSQWHLLAPGPPGSASGDLGTPPVPLSPGGDLGTPPVPLSPGCATCRSESHQENVTQDLAPRECHSPGGTDGTSSPAGGTCQGGRVALGDNPGPVTASAQRGWSQGHSPELVAALRSGRVPDCTQDELALTGHFERPERGWPWPGGRLKSSFNYLLLDPRITRDLPRRSPGLSPTELFRTFVTAVFYVGKGTRARPWWHLHQALAQHRRGTQRGGPKVRRILEIWAGGHGVVPLQCFQHRVPAEALTRESCMLEALGLQSLTNTRRGPCYGVAAAWPSPRRRRLGVLLLHRAMSVLLAEGEHQLRPGDIPGPP